ncbi:MAG: hypothetical protein N4A61_15250 [Pelagimonas sp.]|jgi:hypothetical protein|nr:hypothetical protein [Pelagimonas sp.]
MPISFQNHADYALTTVIMIDRCDLVHILGALNWSLKNLSEFDPVDSHAFWDFSRLRATDIDFSRSRVLATEFARSGAFAVARKSRVFFAPENFPFGIARLIEQCVFDPETQPTWVTRDFTTACEHVHTPPEVVRHCLNRAHVTID